MKSSHDVDRPSLDNQPFRDGSWVTFCIGSESREMSKQPTPVVENWRRGKGMRLECKSFERTNNLRLIFFADLISGLWPVGYLGRLPEHTKIASQSELNRLDPECSCRSSCEATIIKSPVFQARKFTAERNGPVKRYVAEMKKSSRNHKGKWSIPSSPCDTIPAKIITDVNIKLIPKQYIRIKLRILRI